MQAHVLLANDEQVALSAVKQGNRSGPAVRIRLCCPSRLAGMFFSESSHRARWLYTEKDLARIRTELHTSQFGEETMHQDKKRGEAPHEGSPEHSAVAAPSPAAVTLPHVLTLLKWYESKVAGICTELRLPKKVQATALVYFKRCWLSTGVLSLDPLRALMTCIYLAAKIEESYISAEQLCSAVKQDPAMVLRAEVNVLSTLRFDLVVHSPYRALAGLVQDINDMRAAASRQQGEGQVVQQQHADPALLSMSQDIWRQVRGKAIAALDALLLSDALLLYPPGLIALAGLRSGCRARSIHLTTYVSRALANSTGIEAESTSRDQLAWLTAQLDRLDVLGTEGARMADHQEAIGIDRNIKQWKACNPLNDPDSSASKQAQLAEAKHKAERREAKLKARKEAAAAEEARLLGTSEPLKPAAS